MHKNRKTNLLCLDNEQAHVWWRREEYYLLQQQEQWYWTQGYPQIHSLPEISTWLQEKQKNKKSSYLSETGLLKRQQSFPCKYYIH